MKIFIGYDHRGRNRAYLLMEELLEKGYDVNTPFDDNEETLDYPDVALKVCKEVRKNNEKLWYL